MPPFATAETMLRICSGSDTDLLPHRNGANRNLRPARRRLRQAAFFAGQINIGRAAETQAIDVSREPFVADPRRA